MNSKAAVVIAVLTAVALALAGAAFSRSSMSIPTLKGVVGPGFTIKLTKGGKKVKTLKAGKYRIVVTDKATIHNFTLEREHPSTPHFEKQITATAFTGTKTITWTLKPGSWRAYCSNHEALIHLDFKVIK